MRILIKMATLASAALVFGATAQVFPERPIRLVVPFSGGGHDAISRIYADALSAELKQPVIVDNRAGANGSIGAEVIATSKPDGYTIGLLSVIHTVNAGYHRQLRFDLAKDFTPIAMLGEAPVIFAAHPNAPYNNIAELIRYARLNPGKVNFGSSTNYPLELLTMFTKVAILNVQFRGLNEAVTNILGGNLDLTSGPAAVLIPLIKDGRLKPISIASTQKLKELPGVGTVAETVPGYDAAIWYGLFAPSGAPPTVIARLRTAVLNVAARKEVIEKVRMQGVDDRITSIEPRQMTERIEADVKRWKSVAAATGNYLN
ncbi:MAG: hypothetical protein JWQ07_4232 [Ramlibacter sp.]|nr:hypothetical protein [Ramlibacter sp.]